MSCSIIDYVIIPGESDCFPFIEGIIYMLLGVIPYNLAYNTGNRKNVHLINNIMLFIIPSIMAFIGYVIPSSYYHVGED